MRLHLPTPAALAVLAVAAGACAGPSAKTSAEAAAGGGAKASAAQTQKKPWWRLSQYSRKSARKLPWELDGWREGPGLFSGEDGAFVLFREGERDSSDDSTKPTKVRR